MDGSQTLINSLDDMFVALTAAGPRPPPTAKQMLEVVDMLQRTAVPMLKRVRGKMRRTLARMDDAAASSAAAAAAAAVSSTPLCAACSTILAADAPTMAVRAPLPSLTARTVKLPLTGSLRADSRAVGARSPAPSATSTAALAAAPSTPPPASALLDPALSLPTPLGRSSSSGAGDGAAGSLFNWQAPERSSRKAARKKGSARMRPRTVGSWRSPIKRSGAGEGMGMTGSSSRPLARESPLEPWVLLGGTM
eukprot:PLAT12525.29.p1 GENE.PLAT12525.29~~PLAT12525.29.p1  ORF type:complete len:251 (-),score=64.59 PLAT12525.29:58-810(-)